VRESEYIMRLGGSRHFGTSISSLAPDLVLPGDSMDASVAARGRSIGRTMRSCVFSYVPGWRH
jgi:hypothetical protein